MNTPRRTLLLLGLLSAVTATSIGVFAGRRSSAPVLFRVRRSDGNDVIVEYGTPRNFCVRPLIGPVETWVVDGGIYLYVIPSLATAGKARIVQVAELGALPASVQGAERVAWSSPEPGTSMPAWVKPLGPKVATIGEKPPQRVVVLKGHAALADAQHAVAAGLSRSMNMELCGDAVRNTLAQWPQVLTGSGVACVAGQHWFIDSPPVRASRSHALPEGITIEDLRIKPKA